MFRELARRSELKPFVAREIGPGAQVIDDAQLEAYTRQTAVTAHHPAGTCKMGVNGDSMAVVDDKLRDLVGGNINAPVIMIAERAADLVLQAAA
jgi:4-pyridoxate dehydrogenase